MERLKTWFKDQGLGPEDIPKVCAFRDLVAVVNAAHR